MASYDSAGAATPSKRASYKTLRRMNIEAIFLSLLVPCLLFSAICPAFSFHVAREVSVVVAMLVVAVCGALALEAVRRKLRGDVQYETLWYVFLFLTSGLAVILAIAVGERNFHSNLQGYYDLQHLNEYARVDPSHGSGTQFMDAGRMEFVPGSHVAVSKAQRFKSGDVYCVAPIVSAATPLSYEFWAAGMNCCPGGIFRCGEFDDPKARSGLRVVRDVPQQFYRLAVQEAEASFQIQSEHPLFFTWTRDPAADENALWGDTVMFYGVGVVGHFVLQLLLIVFAVVFLEKREEAKLLFAAAD